jgi:hypothetical protein
MCFTCFHTGFIRGNSIYLEKYDIDLAAEDLANKIFPASFSIELIFANPKTNDSIFRRIKPPEQHMVNRFIRQRAQNEIVSRLRRTSSLISWIPGRISNAGAAIWNSATQSNKPSHGRGLRKMKSKSIDDDTHENDDTHRTESTL